MWSEIRSDFTEERMNDAAHLDTPGRIRRFLAALLFYLLPLAALATLIFLASVILGFLPVSDPS
jgi:hypothetical protein